jgi:DNA-binding helix-hairpin-helix protein with protein kinase domain
MKFLRNYEDYDDVTTRPKVQAEQHGNTDQERNQRTRTLLEKRKDAILDALRNPRLSRGERKLLEAQHKEVKADIRTIKYGAPIRILRELDRKWR